MEILEFTSVTIDRLLKEFQPLASKGKETLPNTLSYIHSHLGARHVVIETDYVCRDFRSEFSALYSKRFKPFPASTTRLHFFGATKLDAAILRSSGSLPEELGYRGYVVLRPTDVCRVGRTMLSPPTPTPDEFFFPCTASFPAHLFGRTLEVTAMPFCQQDSMVMTCAQAAIWMTTNLMARYLHWPAPLPHEITASASKYYLSWLGRPLPSGGLSVEQMVNGLVDLGYSPIFHRIAMDSGAVEKLSKIYKYLESRVPVIVTMGEHAIPVCGYLYDPTMVPPPSPLFAAHGESNLVGYENWICGLLAHDDGVGPYRIIPTDLSARDKIAKTNYFDLLLPSNWPDEGVKECTADQIDGIVVPLPEKVYLTGDSVYEIAAALLEDDGVMQPLSEAALRGQSSAAAFLTSLRRPSSEPIVLRAYFVESNAFRSMLKNVPLTDTLSPLVRDAYLSMAMSRYVWVVELTAASEMKKLRAAERQVYGELILDSTASPHGPSFLAIHLPGVLQSRDVSNERWSTLIIEDDRPYQYPQDFF